MISVFRGRNIQLSNMCPWNAEGDDFFRTGDGIGLRKIEVSGGRPKDRAPNAPFLIALRLLNADVVADQPTLQLYRLALVERQIAPDPQLQLRDVPFQRKKPAAVGTKAPFPIEPALA
jgi:hypothetical protein